MFKGLRKPLTVCGFRLQYAVSTYSCRFRDSQSLSLLNKSDILCSWILHKMNRNSQCWSKFHIFCCGFLKTARVWSYFEQYSVLAVYPRLSEQQKKSKKCKTVVKSTTIWPTAESAENFENACVNLLKSD